LILNFVKSKKDIKILSEVEFKTMDEYFKWREEQKVIIEQNKKYAEDNKKVVCRFDSYIYYEGRINDLKKDKK